MLVVYLTLFCATLAADELTPWMRSEYQISKTNLKSNISPRDSVPGIVIASPSRQDPDYYFHWIRDSALVMDSLLTDAAEGELNSEILKTFDDFLTLSRQLQMTPSMTGLGEPRFNVDGSAYTGVWARPQNDGPALRALTLLHALEKGVSPKRQEMISQILETDLDFIQKHSNEPSFDIWEEIRADHFYTRIVQMAALQKALQHFDMKWKLSIFDCEAARAELQNQLDKHWQSQKKYFSISLNRIEGGQNKKTDLDTAVVLGILHAGLDQQNLFSVRDPRLLQTAIQLERVFQNLYEINFTKVNLKLAPAIGRYDDDVYFGGNPWYLTTLAFAELHYRLAASLQVDNNFLITALNLPFLQQAWEGQSEKLREGLNLADSPKVTGELVKALVTRGDQFLLRVKFHTPEDGALAEQFSRQNGFAVSARDLTWSYASFLTAVKARDLIKFEGGQQ